MARKKSTTKKPPSKKTTPEKLKTLQNKRFNEFKSNFESGKGRNPFRNSKIFMDSIRDVHSANRVDFFGKENSAKITRQSQKLESARKIWRNRGIFALGALGLAAASIKWNRRPKKVSRRIGRPPSRRRVGRPRAKRRVGRPSSLRR